MNNHIHVDLPNIQMANSLLHLRRRYEGSVVPGTAGALANRTSYRFDIQTKAIVMWLERYTVNSLKGHCRMYDPVMQQK